MGNGNKNFVGLVIGVFALILVVGGAVAISSGAFNTPKPPCATCLPTKTPVPPIDATATPTATQQPKPVETAPLPVPSEQPTQPLPVQTEVPTAQPTAPEPIPSAVSTVGAALPFNTWANAETIWTMDAPKVGQK